MDCSFKTVRYVMDESADLSGHQDRLVQALRRGATVPAGRLWGLPELAIDDCWVDIAGASAMTGYRPKTITGWLARKGPKRNPFPTPHRLLYRLYWRRSSLDEWINREHSQ
jgi:predicted DNA-binding transcriptional regulator AlpA